jgi:predicted adenylyl cyclase CyaB
MVWLEVETKLKIPDSEVPRIKKAIEKIATFEKEGTKSDDYFAVRRAIKGTYPKKAFRIRAMKDKFEVNFKKWVKHLWTKDIVVKQEFEFTLKGKEEVEDLLALFKDLGFREWVKKIKHNITWQYNKDKRTSIELNNVKHLGWFMEIEYLCQPHEIEKARNRIREVMKVLELPFDWIDNTGYTKMLWYKGTVEKQKFLD